MSIKSAIRPFVPEWARRHWRRRRFISEQRAVAGQPLAKVFADIYETDAWSKATDGRRYSSGPGSLPDVTRPYEDFIVAWLEARPQIATWVDIGCGDFQVAERILARLSRPVRYIGCDIAANVIAWNQAHFAREGVEFRVLDITTQPPPDGDVVTIREVFQHLSNAAIAHALAQLRHTFREAIVTEATPIDMARPNVDLVSGYRTRDGHDSGVRLDLPPFGLQVEEEHILARADDFVLRTTVVKL